MLTEEMKQTIHELLEGDPAKWMASITGIQTSEELHYILSCYNWDDGYEVPMAIARNANCDLGIAVELFWLAAADSWYLREFQASEFNRDWASFCEFIASRILAGEYANGMTSFRLHVSNAKIYQWRKKGLPEIFLKDVIGLNCDSVEAIVKQNHDRVEGT